MKKVFALVLLFSSFPYLASGQDTLPSGPDVEQLASAGAIARIGNPEVVQQAALALINTLQEQNVLSVAGINLNELKSQFSTVRVFGFRFGFLISREGRSGAINFQSQRSVLLNISGLGSTTKRHQDFLLFHEFVLALGFPDGEYAVTSVFALLADPRISTAQKFLLESDLRDLLSPLRQLRAPASSGDGGITGIGGGGDPFAIEIKIELLAALLAPEARRSLGIHTTNLAPLIRMILELKISTTNEILQRSTSLPTVLEESAGSVPTLSLTMRQQLWMEHTGPLEASRRKILWHFLRQLKARL